MDDTTKKPLVGQVALVTGASRGIGLAIARSLGRLGATLSLCARDSAKLSEAVSKLDSEGISAAGITVDVRRPDEIVRLVDRTQREAGPIDILVNNAGIGYFAPVQDADEKQWDAVLDTNLKGAFLFTKGFSRSLLKQRSGRIISIASVIGLMGNAGQSNYAASKAGLIGFSKSLAKEMASRGVTVNVVAPGFIETDMSQAVRNKAGDLIKKLIPMRRFGKPEDIARMAVFLASEDSSYITGQVLTVDGGLSLGAAAV